MKPVDVISEALHQQTLCDGQIGCSLFHGVEASGIVAALRLFGWRIVDVETLGKAFDKHECVGDWSICGHKCSQSVLDALDEITE